jgi:hypothetical protein
MIDDDVDEFYRNVEKTFFQHISLGMFQEIKKELRSIVKNKFRSRFLQEFTVIRHFMCWERFVFYFSWETKEVKIALIRQFKKRPASQEK